MGKNETMGFEHLTILQIRYLTELEQMEKGRGTIGAIAEKCGVKHPTVSRFFKSCIEKEYLTQSLDFTEKEIHDLAFKCSFEDTRTIGVFKQLNMKDMEKIYMMAR